VALALAIGVSFEGGVFGVVVLLVIAALLGTAFGALSNALALVARKEESLIGAVTFLQLPLVFLSTAFMQPSLMPSWIGTVADFNPVDWAIVAGREAVGASPDWASIAGYCGLLAAFAAVCLALAVKAFGAYQKQV